MPITETQREARRKHLGSSDVAAILGVDPFKNAYDVWLEKTGKVDGIEDNQAMFAGRLFEAGVLKFAEKQLGKLIRNQYRSAKNLPIGANIDALVVQGNEPVEAKTCGLYGPLREEWGEDGTDRVPDRVLVQAHVHMLCAERPVCHVAAFIGGRGFHLYHVPEDKELTEIITEKAVEFWEKNVQADIPPANTVPSLALIKRIRREPDLVTIVPDGLVQKWLDAQQAKKDAEKLCDAAQAELLAALGQAEAGDCSFGRVTYLEQSRSSIDVKAIKEQMPDIAAKYTTSTTYRVLRFKK